MALACAAAQAQTSRIVKVALVVESAQFRNGLGNTLRQQIEADLAGELATALGKQFPFVTWQSTATGEAVVGELIAAVTERKTQMLPEINLEWRARVEGGAQTMPSIFPILLYSSSNVDRPVHNDRGEFRERLRKELVNWLAAQPNRDLLHKEFLKSVPLATSVAIPPGQKIVVIPMPWQQARLAEKSVLSVSYVDKSGSSERTNLMVSGLARRATEPLSGSTQSRARNCTQAGEDIGVAELWARCVEPLADLSTKKLRVRMDTYFHADPDVLDGMLLDVQ